MKFCKMHGLQNDFILINNLDNKIKLSGDQIAFLCERKISIGADGLILVSPSEKADIKMEYYNSDGSAAQVCGNGLRCTAKYAYDENIIKHDKIFIESCGQIYECNIVELSDNKACKISVNMGKAEFEKSKIPISVSNKEPFDIDIIINGAKARLSAAAMPNPHAVIIVSDFDYSYIEKIGSALQNAKMFPQKVNVNFVKINSRENIEVITYERGAGITKACGSGACATSAVLYKKGLIDEKVNIAMPGGELKINISKDEEITMTGQAVNAFSGQINI